MRRADRPEEPASHLQRGVVEPHLDPRLILDLDAVEQVGPPRLIVGRVRVAAIDQRVGDVDRRDRPRGVGPGDAGPDPDRQCDGRGPTISIEAASWVGFLPWRAS